MKQTLSFQNIKVPVLFVQRAHFHISTLFQVYRSFTYELTSIFQLNASFQLQQDDSRLIVGGRSTFKSCCAFTSWTLVDSCPKRNEEERCSLHSLIPRPTTVIYAASMPQRGILQKKSPKRSSSLPTAPVHRRALTQWPYDRDRVDCQRFLFFFQLAVCTNRHACWHGIG